MKTAQDFPSQSQNLDQKKRTYSEFRETNKDDSQTESERKRRKQLQPSKLDIDDMILLNQKPKVSVPSQLQNNMKSFKALKAQTKTTTVPLLMGSQHQRDNRHRLNLQSQSNDSNVMETQNPVTQSHFVLDDTQFQNDEEEVSFDKTQRNHSYAASNLNKHFDENLNLRSIDEIDKNLLSANERNREIKKQLAESMKYQNFNKIPNDWSLKTSLEISCQIGNDKDNMQLSFPKIQKLFQYYVYSTDQKLGSLDTFIASAQEDSMIKGLQMPYFYVRNNNFIALFKLENGKPMAIVNPSKNLAKIIQDQNIIKTVQNISHDEEEEEEKKANENVKESDDELIDDHDRLTFLLDNQNQENQHFNLVAKNQSQLYFFNHKAVQSIYNVLANFIANQLETFDVYGPKSVNPSLAQIIAPSPFINCTYNECQVFYQGKVAYSNKQTKYQIKLYGVFFPQNLQQLCQQVKGLVKQQSGDGEDKEIEVQMRSDEQSKLFTYKKCLRLVKLSVSGSTPYRIMFD